jgi:hypothetical protein
MGLFLHRDASIDRPLSCTAMPSSPLIRSMTDLESVDNPAAISCGLRENSIWRRCGTRKMNTDRGCRYLPRHISFIRIGPLPRDLEARALPAGNEGQHSREGDVAPKQLANLNITFRYEMDISGGLEHSVDQDGPTRHLVNLNITFRPVMDPSHVFNNHRSVPSSLPDCRHSPSWTSPHILVTSDFFPRIQSSD